MSNVGQLSQVLEFEIDFVFGDSGTDEFFSSMEEMVQLTEELCAEVAESGRASGRAELRALTLGGAVWGAFRGNANCGDPPGTLSGSSRVRVHFAGA